MYVASEVSTMCIITVCCIRVFKVNRCTILWSAVCVKIEHYKIMYFCIINT